DAASEPSQPRRRQHEARRLLDQEHIRLQVLDGLDERGEVAAQLPEVPAEDPQAPGLARHAGLPSPSPSTIGAMTRSTRASSSATSSLGQPNSIRRHSGSIALGPSAAPCSDSEMPER